MSMRGTAGDSVAGTTGRHARRRHAGTRRRGPHADTLLTFVVLAAAVAAGLAAMWWLLHTAPYA